ncbi:MAG: hypothetical protein ACRD3M_04040, partial [Thermoanaerobaculia bacterium]
MRLGVGAAVACLLAAAAHGAESSEFSLFPEGVSGLRVAGSRSLSLEFGRLQVAGQIGEAGPPEAEQFRLGFSSPF